MRYNERKLSVLEVMADLGEATAIEIWEELEDAGSYDAARMAIYRYYLMGLLSRGGGKEKSYEITERGINRLSFLREE